MTRILTIFIPAILLLSCTTKQDHVYYILKHPKKTDQVSDGKPLPPPPPPAPFYGQLNFILLDSLVLFHSNHDNLEYAWCGTGRDYVKPPFLHLTPDSIMEIKMNDLQKFLASSIPDSVDRNFFPCISSSTDTIRNKAFKIITDYFKERNIRSYIRNWTEEEQYVITAKIENKRYDPKSIDWKIGFDEASSLR